MEPRFPAPAPFDFGHPEDWPRWHKRFDRYRNAIGLKDKSGTVQVSTLVYSMGDRAEDILTSMSLSQEDAADYDIVIQRLTNTSLEKRNVIYERARFNQRRQDEGETVDTFITALYKLAEHCQYGQLHDKMIRDRIVVGFKDATLAEKLQLDSDLTLEKAITRARQSESVKKNKHAIRSQFREVTEDVSLIRVKKPTKKQAPWTQQWRPRETKMPGKLQTRTEVCGRCGQAPTHSRSKCPAREAKCFKCEKTEHFGASCRSKSVSTVRKMGEEEIDTEEEDFLLLGILESQGSQSWMIDDKIDGTPTRFKIDTGADVTVLPLTTSSSTWPDL